MRQLRVCFAISLVVIACAVVSADPSSGAPAISNARTPLAGVLSGGQPTAEQIAEAATGGFRTVINLRGPDEPGYEWEQAAVERSGMRYVHIPVAGAAGLTRENVERLDATLRAAIDEGPVLLHCASGNRIGAMLALRAAWLRGTDPAEALRVGRAAGLTKLEAEVRALLGLPAETAP